MTQQNNYDNELDQDLNENFSTNLANSSNENKSTSEALVTTEKKKKNLGKEALAKRNEIIREVLDYLCKNFPQAFTKDQKKIKPLKVGIHTDIFTALADQEAVFSKKIIRDAIGRYINSFAYNNAISTDNVDRVDLYGNVVGTLSHNEIEYHNDYKNKIKEKIKLLNRNRKPQRKTNNFDAIKPKAQVFVVGDQVLVNVFNSEKEAVINEIVSESRVKIKLNNGIILPVETKILRKNHNK